MSIDQAWRAGFELEVILGDLGDPHFARELEFGAMDEASRSYCRSVARELKARTGRSWTAHAGHPRRTGFYVVPEYGLDPLSWPGDRLAGVELLTPPLPLADAEQVRGEIIAAIEDMDGHFNFEVNDHTRDCGWHINIDGGSRTGLDPYKFILGVDELLLLLRSRRLFTPYTGTQRHRVGVPILRHLGQDGEGKLLSGSGMLDLFNAYAGRSKRDAANFGKLSRDYLELRHFSAACFFNGPGLVEQLDRIPTSFELQRGDCDQLQSAFLAKFILLHAWLDGVRDSIVCTLEGAEMDGVSEILFEGAPLGKLGGSGRFGVSIRGKDYFSEIAGIEGILLPDVAEAVALLALDLAELRNLGERHARPGNSAFARAVDRLARSIKKKPELSCEAQLASVHEAMARRQSAMERFGGLVSEDD